MIYMKKKLYYSIGEVSKMLDIEPHTLRYWESGIPQLKPRCANVRNRRFDEKDISLLKRIKHLIYDEKYTLEGARMAIAEGSKADKQREPKDIELKGIIKQLEEIKEILIKR